MLTHQPYSLTTADGNSDAYYTTIATFCDTWLAEAQSNLSCAVNGFQAFRATQEHAVTRSFAEVAFEMLVLGVLLREHGGQALDMPSLPAWVLTRLIETQDNLPLPAIEAPAKALRGLIQGLLQPEEDETPIDEHHFAGGASALVERLMQWLEAVGVQAQAERLAGWRDYLAWLDEQRAQAILARCLLMAEDFSKSAEIALGQYTREVGEFVHHVVDCPHHPARWRYDAPLITRSRTEYHLAMLGTEILTRAYRTQFLAKGRKIVIMPDCLCAHSQRVVSNGKCQAERTSLGGKCVGCTTGCKANTITRLGERHGFEAYILPDDYRGVGLGACSKLEGVGVVGISCLLTNWDAGWQVMAAGVPAQGVLLDYAGCKSHWDESGMTTDVNLKKMLALLS